MDGFVIEIAVVILFVYTSVRITQLLSTAREQLRARFNRQTPRAAPEVNRERTQSEPSRRRRSRAQSPDAAPQLRVNSSEGSDSPSSQET